MSITRMLLIGIPATILDAITATGAGTTFALPNRSVVLAWQSSFDVNPAAVNITLRVSIDGVSWTVLDTTTTVGGETRTISAPTAARFVDVNVVTNTGSRAATVSLIAKVANP